MRHNRSDNTASATARLLGAVLAAAVVFSTQAAMAQQSPPPGPQKMAMGASTGVMPQAEPAADDAGAEVLDEKEIARRNTVLAEVNGKKITVGYFEMAVQRLGPFVMQELAKPEGRKEILGEFIKMELKAKEADAKGYRTNTDVIRIKKSQMASIMHKKLAEEVDPNAITESELRAFYDQNAESYHKPAKVRARVIMLKDQAQAQQLLDKLRKDKPSQNEFRRLAQENSQDEATRLRGGDLRFFSRPQDRRQDDPEVDPAIVEAAFSLKEDGDIYGKVIPTAGSFDILMRTGYRQALDVTFEEALPRLKLMVLREKRRKYLEDKVAALQTSVKISYNDENINLVRVDMKAGMPGREGPPGRPGPMQGKVTVQKKGQPKGPKAPSKAPTAP